MAQLATSPLVDVHKVDIDHVNVGATGKSSISQTLNALTPLLTVLITAIGLVFTFCFQLVQNSTEGSQKVDTDWRSAVEKVSPDEKVAATGAFEMQSFYTDHKYGDQAKTIAAVVLPSVPDKTEFDAAFFELLGNTSPQNQGQIITVAKGVSDDIRDLCNDFAIEEKKGPDFCDQHLADFLINPQGYYDEDTQSEQIKKVLTETWKLDSADGGLSTLWQKRTLWRKPIFKPDSADLSGIIFYNNNLKGVDLRQATVDGVLFVGTCQVDSSLLPQGAPTPQCTPPAK